MLTDYHTHLRPDDRDATPSQFFTAANADCYRTVAGERGIAELGVAEHIYRFTAALDVWDHDLWRRYGRDDLDDYCAFVREETDLRLGIEADYVPGAEDRMANLLESREWDYVIGSVHFLRDAAVDLDDPEYDVWGRGESADRVWERYFQTLAEAARSGLYDIMAHPDLVKVWGPARPTPEKDVRFFYEPAIEAIAETGIAVEISTAGLRKPVGELYPARAFLEMVADAGNPVTLSSDAHAPDHLGYGYAEALELLSDVGITHLATFDRRTPRAIPIEDADREVVHRHGDTPPPTIDPTTGRPG